MAGEKIFEGRNPNVVMRWVGATTHGGGPRVAVQADLPKLIVPREAAFSVEYGVRGRELLDILKANVEQFIRDMELQGLTLVSPLRDPVTGKLIGNPQVVTDEEGNLLATYSHRVNLEKGLTVDETRDLELGGPITPSQMTPTSLEDSQGWVDYRIVGVFWAPQVSVEILTSYEEQAERERLEKEPLIWGAGDITPRRPAKGIEIARS